jgi:hypothetical protein
MQKTIFLWLVLLGLCAVTLPAARAQATDPGRIVLARKTGGVTVTVKATQAVAEANNQQEIAQGTIVTTAKGGSVVLVFSNGATINLKEDSVLDIEQYLQDPFGAGVTFNPATATDEPSVSNTKLNLTRGELVGNVKKLNKAKLSTFSVQTPVGAAGIRGTTFRIVYRPDGTGKAFFSLTTTEGNVELATGTVTLPVAASATNAVEVVLEATVNPTTGAVTVTTPAGAIVAVIAPSTSVSVAAVKQAGAEIAQAAATVVFAPTTPAANASPGPVPEPPRTTNGSGNP